MRQPRPIREAIEDMVSPEHTALIIIDVQNDLCGEDCLAMLPRLQRLIAGARAAGVYVVYIQNSVPPDCSTYPPAEIARRRRIGMKLQVTVPGTRGHDFVERIAPDPSELVVEKHLSNSFVGTDLDRLLRVQRIETVVLSGVATNGCVLHTAIGAIGFNYYVVVAEDCVASGDRAQHELALGLLRNSTNYVVESARLLSAWESPVPAGSAVVEQRL